MYKIAGIQKSLYLHPVLTYKLVTNLQVSEQPKFSQTDSELLMKFINSVSIRNQNTAKIYYSRLLFFARFAKENYGIILDKMIQKLRMNLILMIF